MSKHFSKGFTLVELMITVSIVAVLAGVILLNQSGYSESATLLNLADELSLNIREVQQYGIAVKERTPGSNDFSSGFGVSISLLSGGSNVEYIIFNDRNSNGVYDGTWACATDSNSECVRKVQLVGGDYIDSICSITNGGGNSCNVSRVDINFLRPSVEPTITFFNNGGNSYSPNGSTGTKIVLKSISNLSRSVWVYDSGQIFVQ